MSGREVLKRLLDVRAEAVRSDWIPKAKTEMAWLSVLLVEGVKKMIRFLNINF